MTRKDYQVIAQIIKQNREDFVEFEDGHTLTGIIAHQFANYAEQDNPRFNRAKFLTACGVN
jgi:hypothetical protein